jgi:hypothetical protein
MDKDASEEKKILDLMSKLALDANKASLRFNSHDPPIPGNFHIDLGNARFKVMICPTSLSKEDFPDIDHIVFVYAKNKKQANHLQYINEAAGFIAVTSHVN